MEVKRIATKPIAGKKTGTSGLRKKTTVVETTEHFVENWVQSLATAIGEKFKHGIFAVGGDGRYLNKEAIQHVVEIFAGNGASGVVIGQGGLMSTPAVSALIRERKLTGGVILTASHNPAGPKGDWGIKYNADNGEPAPEKITDKIYAETQRIVEIRKVEVFSGGEIDLKQLGKVDMEIQDEGNKRKFTIEIVDPVTHYTALLKEIFDFPSIRNFVAGNHVLFDGMHAVTGVYARRIFCEELGLPVQTTLKDCVPSEDFNGGHPDPNQTYAADLIRLMTATDAPCVGFASDGDGDRNMVVGRGGVVVSPSDSVAVIAHYAERAIPYFARHKLKGVARSMPTSRAIDGVAEKLNIRCFQTPTGWKYFGNLMDAGLANLCGEESFGTGSDHIREKDGIWATLAWLSILTFEKTKSVKDILSDFWDIYGRYFYRRCDYEDVDSSAAERVFDKLRASVLDSSRLSNIPSVFGAEWTISKAEEYAYTDPVDGSKTSKQGIIFSFANNSRLIFRLSGTGTVGATIRVYMEFFTRDWNSTDDHLERGPLMDIALLLSGIPGLTARTAPSVVT
jgi:phosphoglucomutase